MADGFAVLTVSEFMTVSCGVSPLRGRPKDSALWNPAALERLANFLASGAGLRFGTLEKSQVRTAKAVPPSNLLTVNC